MRSRTAFFLSLGALLLFSPCEPARAQTGNMPGTTLPISKARGTILLDGVLDEPDWAEAAIATNFYMNFPYDTALAPFQTEARLTFDEHNLYISFVCYDDDTPDIVQSLRRDFEFGDNDNVSVMIGPYNDRINGFWFSITPLNIQLEGTVATGGAREDSYNPVWDNKWYSAVQKYEDKWVAELSIPFNSIRHKNGVGEWNITFLRWDRKRNLVSSWIATPIQFIPASFAYSGQLLWTEPAPHSKYNISLIPYLAGSAVRDPGIEANRSGNDLEAGFDAKVGITPSLNLDLTLNPDFSQVEVDRQVINLTRFEFQFPELRQFFLENNDIFERAGFPAIRPFFSRRIGLAADSTGNIRLVPILYGARLSGSLSPKWRLSLLNMHTRESPALGLPAQQYTVAAVQRNFWKQSNIAVMWVDKSSVGITESDTARFFNRDLWVTDSEGELRLNRYNRVFCVDVDLFSADNRWMLYSFYSLSFDPLHTAESQSGAVWVQYNARNLEIGGGHSLLQRNYIAEAGFVPGQMIYPGMHATNFSLNTRFLPKNSSIAVMGPRAEAEILHLPDGTLADHSTSLGYAFEFTNTSSLSMDASHTYQLLTVDFHPLGNDRYTLFRRGEEYRWQSVRLRYRSDQRKLFNFSFESIAGGFYNGSNLGISGQLNYRYQPYGSLSVRMNYNDIRLPDNYGQQRLLLIGPRADLTLTDQIFFTVFVQYNQLMDNINLNTRFQWRYKPASDLFVVYTENYLPAPFASRNRALVLKCTYWLNL